MCVCVVFRCFGWAAQSGSTAVDAEFGVVCFPEGFVCLDKVCLQNECETQCLRLRRLSAGGGKGLGIASPRGCCTTLERRFNVVSHARQRRAAEDLIATAHSARPGI